jgi:hypothetical protein
MFSLELCRAIYADREREVERAMRRRRLLEVLAIRPASRTDEGPSTGGRETRTGPASSSALGPAR